jgi:PIN domain nuclease of toxin-antitoxin system
MADDRDQISEAALEAIEKPNSLVIISAVVIWEVAIKRRLGKLEAPPDMLAQLEAAQIELLAVSARHGQRAGDLPLHHRDPFDRLLIAQAEIEGLSLVSADNPLRAYDIEVLW